MKGDLWVSFNREGGPTENTLLGGSDFEKVGMEMWHKTYGVGGPLDMYAILAAMWGSDYEISGVPPGKYLVTVEKDGKKLTLTILVTDEKDIQSIALDIKFAKFPPKNRSSRKWLLSLDGFSSPSSVLDDGPPQAQPHDGDRCFTPAEPGGYRGISGCPQQC